MTAENAPILIDMDNNMFRTPESMPCKICGGILTTHIKRGRIIGVCVNQHVRCESKSYRSPTVLKKDQRNDINLYWMLAAYIYVVEKWNADN
jgi:C4-type Zn-finger protein